MLPAAMLPDADGSVAPTLRVVRPAVCATLLLVTPLPTVTVHCSYASSVAVAAVRVSVAVLVVDALAVAVNVVVPHLFALTLARVPNVNVGSTRVIASLLCTSGVLSANMNEMDDGPSVTGLSMVSTLCWNAGVGATSAVDSVIDVVALAMSFAAARPTPTLRVAAFAPWFVTTALVVTPVSTVTVHLTSALMSALAAVSVSVAVAVPVLLPAAANVVLPHPAIVSGDAIVPIVKVGSTSAMVSACFSGALSSNSYATDDAAHVSGLAITRLLYVNAGSST